MRSKINPWMVAWNWCLTILFVAFALWCLASPFMEAQEANSRMEFMWDHFRIDTEAGYH